MKPLAVLFLSSKTLLQVSFLSSCCLLSSVSVVLTKTPRLLGSLRTGKSRVFQDVKCPAHRQSWQIRYPFGLMALWLVGGGTHQCWAGRGMVFELAACA